MPVMRHTRILAIAGLSTALLGSANAEIESSASVGYHTDYIYRGINLGETLTQFGLDFSGTTDVADWNLGFSYYTWDEDDILTGGAVGGLFDEIRISASVSKCISDTVTLSAGMVHHSYQEQGQSTLWLADRLEPFVGISTSLGGIDLSAKVYFNVTDDEDKFEAAHDTYYEVSASYSVDLGGNLSGSLSANYGVWDTDPFLGLVDDVDVLTLTGALNYAASDSITLSAYITHSMTDENALLVTDDETFGGVSVSVGF